ncbi:MULTISPECIES: hypothetical protein [unclassified Agromyces]|uniref:hypothetical protein n=1 Tax=unclassified Agromyces TaxID=2639701 RepID=UPI0030152BB8
MSTAHHPPRPMVAGRSPADDDQLRFDRFWVAYTASAGSTDRWMTSVAAAWGRTAPGASASAVR